MARIPRRGSIYYIQQAIPRDLHSAWGAKQEWRSLHTPDCETAKGRHLEAKLAYRRRFTEMRAARAAKAQQTTATKAALEPDVDWEGLEVMERHWQEVDARKETDPLYRAQVRHAAMLDREVTDKEWQAELWDERRAAKSQVKGDPLGDVVDQWALTQTNEKTVDRMRAVVAWFEDFMGKVPIQAVTPDDVWTFRAKLLEKTTRSNARVKLRLFNTLMRVAKSQRRRPDNPAADISVAIKADPEDQMLPFDLPALAAIFGSPVFLQAERPAGGSGEAAYWLPLLALFTGARLNELGQLRPSDILQETYVDANNGDVDETAWVIRIVANRSEGLKLKNAGSARRVPIHADLIRLGFLDFAAGAKGQARIFGALRPDKYDHITANWSKWFGRYLRKVCGVTDPRMVFHSFRHSFRFYALQVGIPDVEVMAIMGHTGPEVKAKYGGPTPQLSPLVEATRRYRVPGFTPPSALRVTAPTG